MPFTIDAETTEQDTGERDLTAYLNHIWKEHFMDIPRVNTVHIGYCFPWKSRLGLIRLSLDQTTTFIGINSLLQLPQVPSYVLITTIAHELAHYAHGFGSPLPRRHKYPHANGIVERELESRELGKYLSHCNKWIDNHWYSFYDVQHTSGWVALLKASSSTPTREPIMQINFLGRQRWPCGGAD
jgi:hypothetical protein